MTLLSAEQQSIRSNSYRFNPYLVKSLNPSAHRICPEKFLPALHGNQQMQLFMAQYLLLSIKKNTSLCKFEKHCKSSGFTFSRRSLYGIIAGDRGNFKLSWFACLFHLLGVELIEVLRAYIVYYDEQKALNSPDKP